MSPHVTIVMAAAAPASTRMGAAMPAAGLGITTTATTTTSLRTETG